VQARWPSDRVTIEGRSNSFVKTGDSGNSATFRFCPECGSDVYYTNAGVFEDLVAIPLGAFDDPFFLQPVVSVWESRKHDWVEILGDDIERM
jgi:hypothetical protein